MYFHMYRMFKKKTTNMFIHVIWYASVLWTGTKSLKKKEKNLRFEAINELRKSLKK